MAPSGNEFAIWQWNCAGFRKRKASLQQYMSPLAVRPHVIALQETIDAAVALPGYRSVSVRGEGQRGLAILVARKYAFVEHKLQLGNSTLEAQLVEIIPNNWLKCSIFILNVYSTPRNHKQAFSSVIAKAAALAGKSPLVAVGDFNAHHPAWGYPKATVKGRNLVQAMTDCSLELVTDPQFPTRVGTSVTRDTTPDLAFTKNAAGVQWANLQESLGSDHFILSVTQETRVPPPREFRVTDWDEFRKLRKADQTEYGTLEDLFSRLAEDALLATKTVQTDLQVDAMDSRLAHLLEAKKSLVEKWRTQKLNRRLRKRISLLNKEIEDYCQELSRQQWNEVCSKVDGQMRTGGKWNLLKVLLDETNSKGNQRLAIDRLVQAQRSSGVDDTTLLTELAERYLPLGPVGDWDYPDYRGGPLEAVDSPFTKLEIEEVLHELNSRSAPGPDGITNRLLRNLDDKSIAKLTEEVNLLWAEGRVPEAWRTASVVLIPKPGKALAKENLRPISLTSCVGKVMEHAVYNRVIRHIEDKELFPHNMVGFRPGLSTQDVMLLIKRQIIDRQTRDIRGVLALDLAKAFDTISHKFVLEAVESMGLGPKFHAYVRAFLRDRTATIKIGQLKSRAFTLGARGTPQGAVISPLLFNIAMKGLSERLSTVANTNHALYADDVTVWCMGGSDAEVEEALQSALSITESFLEGTGLRLSPSKSELLLYRPVRPGRRPSTPLDQVQITLTTRDGLSIPRVNCIRVLGLLLESNGRNSQVLARITSKTENMLRLILRVSNRRGGLRESNLLRLYHAFLMSHINYVASALNWSKSEEDKLDTLMRKSIKRVLGLPMSTGTDRLMSLGMHNTLSEVTEAQKLAQVARLSSTKAGQRLLQSLGCRHMGSTEQKVFLTQTVKATYEVEPFPRNVHPQYNVGRRKARARSLLDFVAKSPGKVAFVDAAQYGRSDSFAAVVVDHRGRVLNSASVGKVSASVAEQVAIALAMKDPSRPEIFTDSRAAVRAFASGVVSREAATILSSRGAVGFHTITWFPAHMGLGVHPSVSNVNELAHNRAREITCRGGPGGSAGGFAESFKDPLGTFHEVTSHYQLSRRRYPLPHSKLTRPQSSVLRMLQAGSFPSRSTFSHFAEGIDPGCPSCRENKCTLAHMLWQCPALCGAKFSTQQDWERTLKSGELSVQLSAVQEACERAEGHGLPVPAWARPATVADPPSGGV